MREIKRFTIKQLKEYKDKPELDIVDFFLRLQASIIIQFGIGGEEQYKKEFDYEMPDGSKVKKDMIRIFNQLIDDVGERIE